LAGRNQRENLTPSLLLATEKISFVSISDQLKTKSKICFPYSRREGNDDEEIGICFDVIAFFFLC
jgi:hypothetical protein